MEVEEMMKLTDKQKIITEVILKGKSQRSVAQEMGISRNTVSKYVNEYEAAKRKLVVETEKGVDSEEIIEEIMKAPKYVRVNSYKPKMTQAIEKYILEKIAVNTERRRNGMRKQCMNIKDMHEELIEMGHDIGYTSVRNFVRKSEEITKESFIRQEYSPGECVEFDWGEIKLLLNGTIKKIQVAVFASAYSNEYYAMLFHRQNTECFLQAHAEYLEAIGGVPRQLVYDNMKVAIRRFVGYEKEPTDAMLGLSTYYCFDFRFCNIRKGNEKGHVEKGVGVIEKKVFSRRIEFESLEEAQEYLFQRLQQLNQPKTKKILEERQVLGKKMPKMEVGIMRSCKVDKYATIRIENNHYSVPEKYAQKSVNAKVYPGKIVVYDMKTNQKVTRHERCYGKGEWIMNLNHYLETFKKKPGALAGATALAQAHITIKNIYQKYFTKKTKEFIALLQFMYTNTISVEQLEGAVKELEAMHLLDITADKIQLICQKKSYTPIPHTAIEEISRDQLKQFSEMMA